MPSQQFGAAVFVATAIVIGCASSVVKAQQGPQGKIVLVQGRVDSAPASNQNEWNPARLFQELYVSDRVRTLTASRSAILFIDETQVKLNAGAVLTVQQIKTRGGPSTTQPARRRRLVQDRRIQPAAPRSGPLSLGGHPGTEINLVVRGNDAVLTVTEGAAEFPRTMPAQFWSRRERKRQPFGPAADQRTLLNPEDAVQWVLLPGAWLE